MRVYSLINNVLSMLFYQGERFAQILVVDYVSVRPRLVDSLEEIKRNMADGDHPGDGQGRGASGHSGRFDLVAYNMQSTSCGASTTAPQNEQVGITTFLTTNQ